ncbi:hypothetical protein ACO0LF_26680 [Undibacterium sp. Di27W]|uniref:hypothetical protein n=1 Tax=Undibacterium sp. Di27W TaxID=3413036 RepID=UPI003BF38261
MKFTTVLLSMLLSLSASSLVYATPASANANGGSSSSFKMEGDTAISSISGEAGIVTENGNVLELKNGELSLNGTVIYKKKGALKIQMVRKGSAVSLTVDGKDVPVPEQKKK